MVLEDIKIFRLCQEDQQPDVEQVERKIKGSTSCPQDYMENDHQNRVCLRRMNKTG